jgi:flagella basal body P-ring formation protein FlgA
MHLFQLLGFLILCSGGPDAAPSVTVKVRAESEVSGKTFTVGEIADIGGTDRTLAAQVASVEVGASPLPGLSRPLLPGDIVTHLRYHRLDLTKIGLIYPPAIKITRGGKEIPPAEIVKAASDRLAAQFKDEEGVSLEAGALPVRWVVMPGKLEYLPGEPRIQSDGSAATVPVTIMVDGKIAKQVDIPFKIRRVVTALVAKRLLPVHTLVTPDDVATAKVEATAGSPAFLTDSTAVIGKRTKRQIALGAPLTEANLETAPVVTAGTPVTVEIVSGGLRISAPAIARESGGAGDRIRVFATDTKKELTGIVVDGKTVRVED